MFNIHKVTLMSFEPKLTASQIKVMFGQDIQRQPIPDEAIKKRGAEWFYFKTGGRAEIHIIKPFKLKYNALLKQMDHEQKTHSPLQFGIFENHVGIIVPNLTSVIRRIERFNLHNSSRKQIQYILFQRQDGLYQLYVDLHGCVDYLEIDSFTYDYTQTHNKRKAIRFSTSLVKQFQDQDKVARLNDMV